MNLRELPVLFFDIQSTGSTPASGDILEMAWALKGDVIQSYILEQEDGYIPYRIQAMTGIQNEDLERAVSKDLVKERLLEIIKTQNPHGVIHFARFEIAFLKNFFGGEIPFPILCTHEITKRLYPDLPTKGIKGFAGFYGYQKQDLKRSTSHIEATSVIWEGLLNDLEQKHIYTLDDLHSWLQLTVTRKREKFEYPLSKEKRLTLSKKPGVYRMLNRAGEILYVGKATSLHSRVNSYFRGNKNRDPRHLEMLTQVWDLQVTECRSPLEAALLETDEIKKWDPPYNVNLKSGRREMTFFNRDFSSYSKVQDEIHQIGPFSHQLALDSVRRLARSLQSGEFDENIFYDPISSVLLEEGFKFFCACHQLDSNNLKSVRSLLALGLKLLKKQKATEDGEESLDEEEIDSEEEEVVLTPIDVAEKFGRHLIRSARCFLRARALTKLLNSDVSYIAIEGDSQVIYKLRFHSGRLADIESSDHRIKSSSGLPWAGLTIEDYDRMSVLYSELVKLKSKDI